MLKPHSNIKDRETAAGSYYFVRREACPACHGSRSRQVYECSYTRAPIREYLANFYGGRVDFSCFAGAVFSLRECGFCGLIYQEEIPGAFLMQKLYDEWIDPEADRRKCGARRIEYYAGIAREIMKVVAHYGPEPSGLRVLDVGMGWGEWCRMAGAFGCRAFGMELSEARIAHAQRNNIEVIDWKDLRKHKFHFINTEQVFEHLPYPLESLTALASALEDNGMIKIGVPTSGNMPARLRKGDWNAPFGSRDSLNAVAPLEHINCFTANSIARMGALAGLQPFSFPLLHEYSCTFIGPARTSLKALLRPIYHRIHPVSHYLTLRK